MAKQNKVAATTAYVVPLSKDVWIDPDACEKALQGYIGVNYDISEWSKHELNPQLSSSSCDVPCDEVFNIKNLNPISALNWIFTVDLMNFSFWSNVDDLDTGSAESQRYSVEYNGHLYTGYWALCAAINKAMTQGIAFTSPSTWTQPGFESLLQMVFSSASTEQIPLFEERLHVLREAAEANKVRKTCIYDLIKQADGSALKLIDLVTETYPSFDDKSIYNGETVYINKRAQILVADIWGCFQGTGLGKFDDIDELTMFADYRVPQILYTLGCLKYSPELKDHILSRKLIPHGDPREVEIRACSIQAVEVMLKYLQKNRLGDKPINAILLDFYLWDTAKQHQKELATQMLCHRTRSIYY